MDRNEERSWRLVDQSMKKVKEYEYLGITIGNEGLHKERNNLRVNAEKNNGIINSRLNQEQIGMK